MKARGFFLHEVDDCAAKEGPHAGTGAAALSRSVKGAARNA